MPKLTQCMPSYCLHRASGQAIVKLSGKVHYLGRYGTKKSKAKYKRLVGEWLTTDRQPAPACAESGELTVVELLARYMPFAVRHYRKGGEPTGEIDNIRYAIRPLKEIYGRTQVKDFGPLALKALQNHLIDQGVSRKTVNSRIGIIRRIFRWGVSEQLCPPSLLHALSSVMGLQAGRTNARETAPIRPVQDSVVEATLQHLPTVVADMVRVQRLLGCRPGEICSLRPLDIDRSEAVWTYRPATHKTEHHHKDRVILIGPKAQAILKPYLERDSLAHCFQPHESEQQRRALQRVRRKTRVQPSQFDRSKPRPKTKPGTSYTVVTYRRAITRACDLAFPVPAALPVGKHQAWKKSHRWHPNQLRHTAATEFRKQFGVEAARVLLGHSKISTTEIYADRDLQQAAEIMKEIG